MSSLRSILGGSRVKKRTSSSSNKARASPSSSSSPWTSSLPRTKAAGAGARFSKAFHGEEEEGRLEDIGPVRSLAAVGAGAGGDLAQAHRLIRAHMFDPIPEKAAGMNSTKIASVLNFRAALPPVVSAAHVAAACLARTLSSSPAAAEREVAKLVRAGKARRVVIPTRGAMGELIVLSDELEAMLDKAGGGSRLLLDDATRETYKTWLRENPAATQVREIQGLDSRQADQLVRAGFLTGLNDAVGRQTGVYARPDARYEMISVETVSRAAAGTVAAVGGEGAIHEAGGTGQRGVVRGEGGGLLGGGRGGGVGILNVSVPGSGVFLKLVANALDHLTDLLVKRQYREMPEKDLREKWNGGIADSEAALVKKARGEFVGILPGRTKKWRDFHGLAFDWVLQEAVGAGLVEVFETRSVGRGVRSVV
ncbi:serine-threonine protein kinase 19-domain-containing protein [Podospora didyma]|uniref:Serine-threonine protein kinase 19-domain-containing protein n=1 Tax=Podospora didyma TaxID=330526 RepID=A0AAE0P404_9PEZI|nr:serine-threonine protein kinase 19-domain-containing protein [Podospora didyma]